jgi:dynein heavy chain, axonemal
MKKYDKQYSTVSRLIFKISVLAGLVADITFMASLIPRLLKTENNETYMDKIASNIDIDNFQKEILSGVDKVVQEAADFCHDFERYTQ